MRTIRSLCPVSGRKISMNIEDLREARLRKQLEPRTLSPAFQDALEETRQREASRRLMAR